jgi:hypothetical protein
MAHRQETEHHDRPGARTLVESFPGLHFHPPSSEDGDRLARVCNAIIIFIILLPLALGLGCALRRLFLS